jgi:hypothetical protein
MSQPSEDEVLALKYLYWIQEDILWRLGSLKQHTTSTEFVLINNCLIGHNTFERLKELHNITVLASKMSGVYEWDDLPTILMSEPP